MLVEVAQVASQTAAPSDVTVVGTGPAGIVCALELARHGCLVTLVESGLRRFSAETQALGNCDRFDPRRQAPMDECTRRQLGGTSVLWAGRCVPFDPIDFEPRPYIPEAEWPIRYADISPFFARASAYLLCGPPLFNSYLLPELRQKHVVPNLPDGDIRSSDLESWSLPTNFGREYYSQLRDSPRIRLVQGLSVVEISTDTATNRVTVIRAKTLAGQEVLLTSNHYVLACGGLETTRLLMASDRHSPGGLGTASGLLGRHYMGHLTGRIARVSFRGPPHETVCGFWRGRDGVYKRPRFTFSPELQRRESLGNISAWIVNPTIADPAHQNGVLSFAYLALRSRFGKLFAAEAIRKYAIAAPVEYPTHHHLLNIVRDLPRTLAFIPKFGAKRFLFHRRVPAFYEFSHSNSYYLNYHSEQVPNRDSRVTLSDQRDALGLRRLNIDLRFSEQDVDSVVRAHTLLDSYLRKHGVGQLDYLDGDARQSVWDQATDGFHQAGLTRMSADPNYGVVDANCKVNGVENLYLASSSVFPTSGQANPTFTIVAFAVRLAEHLKTRIASTSGDLSLDRLAVAAE